MSDIEFDVDLIIRDREDLFDYWSPVQIPVLWNNGQETSFRSEPQLNHTAKELSQIIDLHFDRMSFFSFASEALAVESSAILTPLSVPVYQEREKLPDVRAVRNALEFFDKLPQEFVITTEDKFNSARDDSIKQLKRDLERDKISINGVLVVGSLGLDRILSTMKTTFDKILRQIELPILSADACSTLSDLILKKVSRTNSGGATFQTLRDLLEARSTVIVPLSAKATPLRVKISAGSFTSPNTTLGDHSNFISDKDTQQSTSTPATASPLTPASYGLKVHLIADTYFRLNYVAVNASYPGGDNETNLTDISDESNSVTAFDVRGRYNGYVNVNVDPRRAEISEDDLNLPEAIQFSEIVHFSRA